MNDDNLLKINPKQYLGIFSQIELGKIYKNQFWKTELFGL